MSQFTIAELSQLSFEIASREILSAEVMQILREVEASLVIPSAEMYSNNNVSTNTSRKPAATSSNNISRGAPLSRGKSASATPAFKTTKIASAKTGIDKTVNDIRIALNKISATNFDKQRSAVLEIVSSYFGSEDETEENTHRIAKAIFEIAITNKFYSDMYVSLYKTLVDTNDVFRTMIDEFVANFTVMDGFPVYVDPDTDYDGFCVYSKACDAKKSASTFLVNCLKHGLIYPSQIGGILCKFLAYIQFHISQPGYGKIVEELVENIFILATLCSDELRTEEMWDSSILTGIRALAAEKGNNSPSLSNRAAFKCMDILDKL